MSNSSLLTSASNSLGERASDTVNPAGFSNNFKAVSTSAESSAIAIRNRSSFGISGGAGYRSSSSRSMNIPDTGPAQAAIRAQARIAGWSSYSLSGIWQLNGSAPIVPASSPRYAGEL